MIPHTLHSTTMTVLGHITCTALLLLGVSATIPYSKQNTLPFWIPDDLIHETCSAHSSDLVSKEIQDVFSSISAADCELSHPSNYPPHYSPTEGEVFDFIIVGAGSAGAVVANRLTELPSWKVLLLEAGGDPSKTSEVPAMCPFLQKTEEDWQYHTEPEEINCLGMENERCNWPRGKVLGGSSTINFMVYVRGNPKDYDQWAADGNTGWGYEDVLPYFKKSEDMRAEEVLATPEFNKYHNTGGYLSVESYQKNEVKPLSEAFAKGMEELGYHQNPDCNGKTQAGYVTLQGTLKDGRRCSTAKAFLTPIKDRSNLKVSKHSLVTKLLIDDKDMTAYGVAFINENGKVVRVGAKKEVIVSAGAINTPQLLMLSGIGPKEHLDQFNITVIQDLPVGQNLEDHMLMGGLIISHNFSRPIESPEEQMFDFLLKRKRSRYSGLGLGSYASFINTIKGMDYPDVESLIIDFARNDTSKLVKLLRLYGYKDEIIDQYLEIISDSNVILVLNSLLRPYSKGLIQLRSTDPKDPPKITAGYFTDQRDIDTFLRAYDFVSEFVQTEGLKSVNAELHEIKIPQCSKSGEIGSRKYRECALSYLTSTTYHHCSSCKMGTTSSPDSVVDPHLRVKGINKLRIIDASIMPSEVSGNINAAVIMIGEKGSDLVKETWLSGKVDDIANNGDS